MTAYSLADHPVHLGLGAKAVVQPETGVRKRGGCAGHGRSDWRQGGRLSMGGRNAQERRDFLLVTLNLFQGPFLPTQLRSIRHDGS